MKEFILITENMTKWIKVEDEFSLKKKKVNNNVVLIRYL